ncbi:hypothetical protein HY488_00320, partial [Candidatus Woesearchaeota archaeon]|nr:hypothetical protein [Candidatus Woesearchaeota archaeon]
MNKLYLVGEIHADLDIGWRYQRILDILKPKVIGLETTEEDFRTALAKAHKVLDENGLDQAVESFIRRFPSAQPVTARRWIEQRAIANKTLAVYAAQHDVPFVHCDDSEEVARLMASREVVQAFDAEVSSFFSLDLGTARATIDDLYEDPIPGNLLHNTLQSNIVRDAYAASILRQKVESGDVIYFVGLN